MENIKEQNKVYSIKENEEEMNIIKCIISNIIKNEGMLITMSLSVCRLLVGVITFH